MARNATTKNTAKMPAIAAPSVKWSLADVARKYIEMARNSFEEKKAKFINEVASNPAYAIRWAEGIMQEQAEYECWIVVEKFMSCIGTDHGNEIGVTSARDAVVHAVNRITDDLMSSIGSGESTSLCSRAHHTAEQVGRKSALPRIKALLTCED